MDEEETLRKVFESLYYHYKVLDEKLKRGGHYGSSVLAPFCIKYANQLAYYAQVLNSISNSNRENNK